MGNPFLSYVVFYTLTFKYLLPLDLELNNDGLIKWLYRRIIPKNRAYVENFLAKLGLNRRDLIGIIRDSKLLSLNDCFFCSRR